ncbi:MAG: SOS response-associated peptidase [Dehalococcoidia bacterium]
MCGRFTLAEPAMLGQRFGVQLGLDASPDPRYNVAPSEQISVVIEEPEGRVLRWMRWGFQPGWLKDPKRPPPINARAETLVERPLFRGAVARGRCLIPASGFYEWQAIPGRRTKQPIYIRLKDGGLFGFAGLYTEYRDETDGEPRSSCAIITTAANELMAPIHQRMPVIMRREDEGAWLDRTLSDPKAALVYLRAYPAEAMEAFAVSALVSSVRNDQAGLVEPLES